MIRVSKITGAVQFAMRRLDQLPDRMFAPYGIDTPAVDAVREAFVDWPR